MSLFKLFKNKNKIKIKNQKKDHAKQKIKSKSTKDPQIEKIAQKVKSNIQQQPIYDIGESISKTKKLFSQLKEEQSPTRDLIVSIYYSAKYISLYTERIPDLLDTGATFDKEFFTSFNEVITSFGERESLLGALSNDKQMMQKGKHIAKANNTDPSKITKDTMLKVLRQIVKNDKQKLASGVKYFLGNRIITSQDSAKAINTLKIIPCKTVTDSYSSMTMTSLSNSINRFKDEAIDNHCNGVINIHTKDTSDDLNESGDVVADLVKIKGHPLYKGNYPHPLTNVKLYRKLKAEYTNH